MARAPSAPSPLAVVIPMARGADQSDAMLVERARRGDRWAEEAIYLRYVGYVQALSSRLLRTPVDVQDVVQDTFVDVLEQLGSLRDAERLRHWITGIVVHKAHRRFRRRRLRALLGLSDPHRAQAHGLQAQPNASPECVAELIRLDRVLAELPDVTRACWVLRYVEGYTLDEVAGLCRCSLATAKRRIASAHARVRAHVRIEEVHDA